MSKNAYLDFCNLNVGKCAREVESVKGMDVNAIGRCLEKKMREEFKEAYDGQAGHEAAQVVAAQYY